MPVLLPIVADSLGLAVIAISTVPLLLMSADATIIAASLTFLQDFDLDADAIIGKSLYAIADGAWKLPRLQSLLDGTASGQVAVPAYEIDVTLPALGLRRLVLNAHRLEYPGAAEGPAGVRLMLAIADVTEARASDRQKDALIREKADLMHELQHGIANSLQIIASVLMQSARSVGTAESSVHLRDAHHRVIAIAELQRHLAETGDGGVAIAPYLNQLCQSLSASMIGDHDQTTLVVNADNIKIPGNASVSMGLIVTELVINALKHAFPDGQRGAITVDYRGTADDWRLTVTDDGIGMDGELDNSAGLGTNIVNALARHLEAKVHVSDAKPGTRVEIVHTESPDGKPTGAPADAAV
jgi:two-component sensor histidine kinase